MHPLMYDSIAAIRNHTEQISRLQAQLHLQNERLNIQAEIIRINTDFINSDNAAMDRLYQQTKYVSWAMYFIAGLSMGRYLLEWIVK